MRRLLGSMAPTTSFGCLQEAMLDGIRRTYGSSKPPIKSQQQQEEQELK